MNSSGKVERTITRRDFVKRTALTGAAAVAMGAGSAVLPVSGWPSTSVPKITGKMIRETARETRVVREADVVVVGGGPGGIGAALAAARNGVDTVLIERYGYLGGMGTGGLVTILPCLSDLYGKQGIAGINQEWIDRLETKEACDYPKKEHWGSDDKKLVEYYGTRSFFNIRENRVVYAVHIDAEMSKAILNEMVQEAGVKTYFHSWGTEPILDGNTVKGVIFESKSGRQAVLGKVVIDSTGDGDLLPYTGADFESEITPGLRISHLSLCYWIANVDVKKFNEFRTSHPEEYRVLRQDLKDAGGHGGLITSNIKKQENLVWMHPRYPSTSQVDVEELTRVEFEGRRQMLITHDYHKKHTPGFENSYIVLSGPQLGTRGSRRVIGDYVVTEKNMDSNEPFEDTIALFPDVDRGKNSFKYPVTYIPYRALIPRKVEGLLVACRAFASDMMVNEYFNLIPHCIAFGQAAGTAAAQSIDKNVGIRKVDIKALQANLKKQGVILPD